MFQEQSGSTPHPGTPPNTNPDAVWRARYDDYKNNMPFLLKMHQR